MKHRFKRKDGAAKIMVAGCGGTGSQMLISLARLNAAIRGLGGRALHIDVCDPDKVSPANCARQSFYDCDVGCNKAEVLADRLRLCFPDVQIRSFPQKYKAFGYYDFLISCVDSRSSRREIINNRRTLYHIDCGNGADYGQVLLGDGSKAMPWPEVAAPELIAEGEEDNTPSCSMSEALERQELYVNDFAVRIASTILWDMFRHGGTDIRGAYYNLNPVRITPVKIGEEKRALKGAEKKGFEDE